MNPSVLRGCLIVAVGSFMVNHAQAQAVEAPPPAWYVKVDGGVTFLNDVDVRLGGEEIGTLTFDTGYGFGAAVGRNLTDWLALELDAGLLINQADNADADLEQIPLMLNGIVQLNTPYLRKWNSYVGAGAGAIFGWLDLREGVLSANDTSASFAVQGLAGLRYAATDRISLGMLYRFRWNFEPAWSATVDGLSGSLDFEADDILSHVAAVEFRVRF